MPPTQKAIYMVEEWKDIPGYEGIYQSSTFGRIRTCENKTTYTERHGVRHWKQRILKQKYQERGGNTKSIKRDARISLWKNGKEKTHLVSRLVAMTWCEGYQDGLTVNHIDGNTENNHASNLEWVTLGENVRKGFENGLFPQKSCVIIEENGTEIKFRSYSEASRYLGKNSKYVSELLNNNKLPYVDGKLVLPF